MLTTTGGRAHVLDTSESEPTGYRFRLWGAANSYGTGYTEKSLGQMPMGLMRENALEDYREVVLTGCSRYHLINVTEDRVAYSYARLLLPLANDGRRVDHILALINEREFGLEMQ